MLYKNLKFIRKLDVMLNIYSYIWYIPSTLIDTEEKKKYRSLKSITVLITHVCLKYPQVNIFYLHGTDVRLACTFNTYSLAARFEDLSITNTAPLSIFPNHVCSLPQTEFKKKQPRP